MPIAKQIERSRTMQRSVPNYFSIAQDIICEKSFRKGSIRLSSGVISEYYLDMKPTMFDPKGAWAIAHLVFEKLKGYDVENVGGLEMGAVPLVANVALLSEMEGRPLPGFFVRKTVKEHGTKKLVEGIDQVQGRKVAILDDVTTTGQSAMIAVKAAQEAGAQVVLVLSIVDRLEGASEFYSAHNIPFTSIFTRRHFMD